MTLVLGVLLAAAPMAGAQPAGDVPSPAVRATPEPKPVLLVYAQHRMPEEMWTALFKALEANSPDVAANVPPGEAHPQFVRGDDPANANVAGQPITVYLGGYCAPSVLERPFPRGKSLGWVSDVDGVVVPIIHVECDRIGDAISTQTQWMTRGGRTEAMSQAMARVILHEWVHVATQSAEHGSEGVTKPRFSAKDLLSGAETPNPANPQVQ
jgi:hypothetical protein